jgi:carbamoyl-phosphate synthase large subunit
VVIRNGELANAVVAVTGLHRGESPQPGSSVVMSLRRRFPGLRIVGLGYDPMESSIYSRGGDRLDAVYLLPYPKAGSRVLMERLETVIEREGINVVIPCLDTELPNFISLVPELRARSVHVCVPTLQSFEDRDKTNLNVLCEELKIATPRTVQANDVATLVAHAEKIGFPCYIKGHLYGAHKVRTAAEIYSAFTDLHNVWGGPVLLQEAITGEEFNLVGVGDGDGGILGHCTIRKLLRTRLGKGFAGVVVVDPAIEESARRIIGKLKWNGPFELEYLKRPGRPHALFEMNPRFPAWVDFPSQIGCNLPARMLERMMGLPASPLAVCRAGQMFIRHCTDIVADIGDIASLGTHGDRNTVSVELELEALPEALPEALQ